MRLSIFVASAGYVEVDVLDSATVKDVKAALAEKLKVKSALEWYLVRSSTVISAQNAQISQLGLFPGENICLVPPSSRAATGEFNSQGWIRSVIELKYHFDPNDAQGKAKSLVALLDLFCQELLDNKKMSLWRPTEVEIKTLTSAVQNVKNDTLSEGLLPVTWYEEYGCALFSTLCGLADVRLSLVCLDQWTFEVHSGKTARHHTAHPTAPSPTSLFVGSVKLDRLQEFLSEVQETLSNAQKRKGGGRSAASNRQGHQKTPAMINAIMQDALLNMDKNVMNQNGARTDGNTQPKGGFTDVGLHTGGKSRHTSWPLVMAVMQTVLEGQGRDGLFARFEAQLYLWLAESAAAKLLSPVQNKATQGKQAESCELRAKADSILQALTAACAKGEKLVRVGAWRHEMLMFRSRCLRIRYELGHVIECHAEQIAEKNMLTAFAASRNDLANPSLLIQPRKEQKRTTEGLEKAREQSLANLGWLPAPLSTEASWSELQQWIQNQRLRRQESNTGRLLICKTVETYFFKQAQHELFSPKTAKNANTIERIVEEYRDVLKELLSDEVSTALLSAEMRSRELLVVWIGFCLIHSEVKAFCPRLQEYSVGLDPAMMSHLVLSEKLSVEAVRGVWLYLREHRISSSYIFTLHPSDESIAFAESYAREDIDMQNAWATERCSAQTRKQKRWEQIEEKKRLLLRLDTELGDLNRQRKFWQDELDATYPFSKYSSRENNAKRRTAEDYLSDIKCDISCKEREIADTERAPNPIFQPLPTDEGKALSVLFFLMMPNSIRALSRFSFMAQQMFLPREDLIRIPIGSNTFQNVNVQKSIHRKKFSTDWYNYYAHQSTSRSLAVVPNKVLLGSEKAVPSGNKWYSSNVRNCFSSDNGIWHPDDLEQSLYWKGGGFSLDSRNDEYFNPFAELPPDAFSHVFAGEIHGNDKILQWAISQHGKNTRSWRGNVGEASQDKKPSWFSDNSQYLTLGALRAYPSQQIRKLCIVLLESGLPLDNPTVRVLCQQTLFHIGDIAFKDGEVKFLWRTDLYRHHGWEAMKKALSALVEEHRFKSREHAAVLTMAAVTDHCSQWDSGCRQVSRTLGDIAKSWADKLSPEDSSSEPLNLAETRAKRCLFYMYCFLCHASGEWNKDDAVTLCKVLVLAEHNRLFDEVSSLDAEVRMVTIMTQAVMARRVAELTEIIDRNTQMLTQAVQEVLEAAPEGLDWRRVVADSDNACYEAVSADHLYSINVQTGVVLFDGMPPRRLPDSVLQNALYGRMFGDKNFEVVRDSHGDFKTTRQVAQRFYKFCLGASDKLIVHEIDSGIDESISCLELLDGTEKVSSWALDLPTRLQNMYSHWLCRERNVIIIRPVEFSQRQCHYILVKQETRHHNRRDQCPAPEWECYRVPTHLQHLPWSTLHDIYSNFDRLVVAKSNRNLSPLHVLKKFETDSQYIHIFVDSEQTILYELPRFGLEFEATQEGHLKSKNFASFKLAKTQQLKDTLRGFFQYLIVESETKQKVVMPAGSVSRQDSEVFISGSNSCDAERGWHVYDVHPRFRTIEAAVGKHAVEARLQLAALYTATGSLVPESRNKRTGGQIALELIRQSWVNRPLSQREAGHLQSMITFSNLYPTIPLLIHELISSSASTSHLFPAQVSDTAALSLEPDVLTEYVCLKKNGRLNPMDRLTPEEELYLFGTAAPEPTELTKEIVRFQDIPKQVHAVDTVSAHLNIPISMIKTDAGARCTEEFPIRTAAVAATSLGKEMCALLRSSWRYYRQAKEKSLNRPLPTAKIEIKIQLDTCRAERQQIEHKIISSIDNIGDQTSQAQCFTLRRIVNLEPHVTKRDLVKIGCDKMMLLTFNPFLKKAFCDNLHNQTLKWMELCVLEDKLQRLLYFAQRENTPELIRELRQGPREWDVSEHPHWLAFEVEQGIQIRSLQYRVARFCIQNPGCITQLNMGEGKTRVILPMLILELANPQQLMRIHFLSPLLSEAYDFLHHTLTASLLCRRLYLLPFHRDINLTGESTHAIYRSLIRCKLALGAVCVAPEHRLSFNLKWHELRLRQSDASGQVQNELELIENLSYYDILDESDELLSHKYQLIYAVGNCTLLPAGKERWVVAQALLRQLQQNSNVAHVLATVAKRTRRAERQDGSFDDIRLLPGPELEDHRKDLLSTLATAVFDSPPYLLRWLTTHPNRTYLLSFIIDGKKSLQWLRKRMRRQQLTEHQENVALALRGFLACGLFEHCLTRRYGVDYGIDPRRGESRRVAVPYRASDTPADRSEYAQPDTLIVYTHLAYYHRGISRHNIKEAVRLLLTLGRYAQKAEYDLWLAIAPFSDQLAAIDAVDKLDPASDTQLDMMHQLFQYNMAAIDFWLTHCVLPRETMQFPQRLAANAFNLADNKAGNIIGFSGTKDNQLLLPIQVKQELPDEPQIQATDGKMLDLLSTNESVHCLSAAGSLIENVLELVISSNADALIDSGAAMAGLSNSNVAEKLLPLLDFQTNTRNHRGVVFFDKAHDTWMVKSKDGRSWSLGSSPIQERDALVYFDESHCRGADMKLRDDASAVITIGSFMTKDKLMQAAGRMRKLDRGQSLIFAVPSELVSKIIPANESRLKSVHLLSWVMQNTVDLTASGLVEWSAQGSHFCTTKDPRARVTDELIHLKDLYAEAITGDSIFNVSNRLSHRYRRRTEEMQIAIDHDSSQMMKSISDRVQQYGSDQIIMASAIDEECEREIEEEREIERQIERQIPAMMPHVPQEWDFSAVLRVNDVTQIPKEAQVMHLRGAVQDQFPSSQLQHICWSKCNVYVTNNFLQTVSTDEEKVLNDLSDFLRPVDAILVFEASGNCLLVSEWEADHILSLLWDVDRNAATLLPLQFVNFAYMMRSPDPGAYGEWELSIPGPSASADHLRPRKKARQAMRISDHTLSGLQLFAGYTMYGSAAHKKAVADLLPTPQAKQSALNLIRSRGFDRMISRSDLEEICSADQM